MESEAELKSLRFAVKWCFGLIITLMLAVVGIVFFCADLNEKLKDTQIRAHDELIHIATRLADIHAASVCRLSNLEDKTDADLNKLRSDIEQRVLYLEVDVGKIKKTLKIR